MLSTHAKEISTIILLLLSCSGRLTQARSVKILEVHVELVSTSGSAMICEQRVADALRQVAGTCLSECDSLVGFNSASCNTEIGYDVVTLRGGIFGTSEDVIGSIPCIRATLAADGCGDLANEALPSIGSLRYIGGVETASPTAAPQAPSNAPTSAPSSIISTSSAPTPSHKPTMVPTAWPSATLRPVVKATVELGIPPTEQPVAVPSETLPVSTASPTSLGTELPSDELVLEEGAADFLSEYVVLLALIVTAATLLCCLVVFILWGNGSRDQGSVATSLKAKNNPHSPYDNTSTESTWSSRKRRKKWSNDEEKLHSLDLPSLHVLRDEPSSVLENDELSSDGSSIRAEKFDDASDDEYEAPPGQDETEVTCDASETEDSSEYDFSVSAAEFTRNTHGFDRSSETSSVGSLSTNSFSYYFNFDERDMENEAKRRQFLSWLKTSKIVPPSAKYAIEASLVTTYGPLSDEYRPIEV